MFKSIKNWYNNKYNPQWKQFHLIESDPFGETIFPFEYKISESDSDCIRFSKSWWKSLQKGRKVGFYTSVDVKFIGLTHEQQVGKIPIMPDRYAMGRYTNNRKVYPTTQLNMID